MHSIVSFLFVCLDKKEKKMKMEGNFIIRKKAQKPNPPNEIKSVIYTSMEPIPILPIANKQWEANSERANERKFENPRKILRNNGTQSMKGKDRGIWPFGSNWQRTKSG